MLTLNDLKVGETAVVVKLHGQGAVRRRIMDMGITKGVPVRVRKFAPLGDPVEITVLDYELTLRKNDCALIEVEKRSSDSEQSAL
ncbi:MAG TPA: ferrous iron transport protein A [Clostridiaceae bacterium]|nr:ferrous iron transport protein A [Clostridiaceae bacterium]